MLKMYCVENSILKKIPSWDAHSVPAHALWIDLQDPHASEVEEVESLLDIKIPTREEAQEIEQSSRLYQANGALFMTTSVVSNEELITSCNCVVTFILSKEVLITVHDKEIPFFHTFGSGNEVLYNGDQKSHAVLIGLWELIVDKLADILEKVTRGIETLSSIIFKSPQQVETPRKGLDYNQLIRQVGRNGDLVSKTRESLVGFSRLIGFFKQNALFHLTSDCLNRIHTLERDISSLSDHATFLSNKVNFLLDATLGMINIEQNAIIKIFSIASVVLLPPTLIASIHGMNFHHMPELEWKMGYPLSLLLMFFSAFIPYKYFQKKGWL